MTTTDRLRHRLGRVYGRLADANLTTLLRTMAKGLDASSVDGQAAVDQLDLREKASGAWLDCWGDYFLVPRRGAGETDDQYATRIIAETIQQRPQPYGLKQILETAFPVTADIQTLYLYALTTDRFVDKPGPRHRTDGHLRPDFLAASGPWPAQPGPVALTDATNKQPGAFGVWLTVTITVAFIYTLEEFRAALPQKLLTDQVDVASLHRTDGHLTSPGLGGNGDTARYTFGFNSRDLPFSLNDVVVLLHRHRAAGTKLVIMNVRLTA